MATLVIRQPVPKQSPTPPPHVNILTLSNSRPNSAPIPNKHIPYCSPGPVPIFQSQTPATPPDSPPSTRTSLQSPSPLQPVDRFQQVSKVPPVYSIDASTLAAASDQLATQYLPDPKLLFPWLHGLNPENQIQLQFFLARRKAQRQTPNCYRGITIVKAGGDLTKARLKSAIAPEEVLNRREGHDAAFLEIDPRHGFSVRNFQIQATKMAVMSDVIVYKDDRGSAVEVHQLARKFAFAQDTWRVRCRGVDNEAAPRFNTFILNNSFKELEESYPQLIAIDAEGTSTCNAVDFALWEKKEMSYMARATRIANNVWLGPTPDSAICVDAETDDGDDFDVMIETTDLATAPDSHALKRTGELSYSSPQQIEFPASGSITQEQTSKSGSDPLTQMCQWIHKLANSTTTPDTSEDEDQDSDGDIPMKHLFPTPRKVLIHCADGYTETTLLALAYFMYAEQIPLHEALLRLHCEKGRNFFAYPSDIPFLASLQTNLTPTPKISKRGRSKAPPCDPAWLSRMDGSLPSRILPYMYLGNLGHANNPDLLKAMGIGQVLSVGEPVHWSKAQLGEWGRENMLVINDVQDNGVDPLMKDFDRCLDFIGKCPQSLQ